MDALAQPWRGSLTWFADGCFGLAVWSAVPVLFLAVMPAVTVLFRLLFLDNSKAPQKSLFSKEKTTEGWRFSGAKLFSMRFRRRKQQDLLEVFRCLSLVCVSLDETLHHRF